MWRQDGHREPEEQAAQAEPPVPAPPVVPGSLAWASAAGNHAVARYAALARADDPAELEDAAEELSFAHGEKPEGAAAGPEEEEEAEEELPE
jgi:hypothetical protein